MFNINENQSDLVLARTDLSGVGGCKLAVWRVNLTTVWFKSFLISKFNKKCFQKIQENVSKVS